MYGLCGGIFLRPVNAPSLRSFAQVDQQARHGGEPCVQSPELSCKREKPKFVGMQFTWFDGQAHIMGFDPSLSLSLSQDFRVCSPSLDVRQGHRAAKFIMLADKPKAPITI